MKVPTRLQKEVLQRFEKLHPCAYMSLRFGGLFCGIDSFTQYKSACGNCK